MTLIFFNAILIGLIVFIYRDMRRLRVLKKKLEEDRREFQFQMSIIDTRMREVERDARQKELNAALLKRKNKQYRFDQKKLEKTTYKTELDQYLQNPN